MSCSLIGGHNLLESTTKGRCKETIQGFAKNLLGRTAKRLFRCPVEELDSHGGIKGYDRVHRGPKHLGEALLAGAQRLLRFSGLGEIQTDYLRGFYLTLSIAHRPCCHF